MNENLKDDDDLIIEIVDEEDEDQDELPTNDDTPDPDEPQNNDEDDDDENPPEDDGADDPDSDKRTVGKRAEKRIQQLVARAKAAEERADAADAQRDELEATNKDLETRQVDNEARMIVEAESRITAQEDNARAQLKRAKEDQDIDAEVKITETMANISAQKAQLASYKAQQGFKAKPADNAELTPEPDAAPVRKTAAASRVDANGQAWIDRNKWFNGASPRNKAMSAAAIDMNNGMIEEGYDPTDGAEEFYTELDARLKVEFPEEFKMKRVSKQSVAGGSRTPTASKGGTYRISKREAALAERMGVTAKAYAVEKKRLEVHGDK